MTLEKTVEILKLLADGIDPKTREVLPKQSPYHQVETVRALHTALETLEKISKKTNKLRMLPDNAGKPWENDEDEQLVKEFDSGENIREIARIHKRTTGAILSRLEKLGKMK